MRAVEDPPGYWRLVSRMTKPLSILRRIDVMRNVNR